MQTSNFPSMTRRAVRTRTICPPRQRLSVSATPSWGQGIGWVLGRLLKRPRQSEFLAHLADSRQHFIFHQLETAHCVLVADGAVVGPYTKNPRTKYLQALANLLENGLRTAYYHAIAFDHLIPAGGINSAIKRIGPQRMLVLLQQALRTLT